MNSRAFFEENGFVKMDSFISENEIKSSYNQLKNFLSECANNLNVSESEYLSVIDAWGDSSPIIKQINEAFLGKIKLALENMFSRSFENVKLAIRGKSSAFPHQTATHQDLPYSIKDPYEITVWLSLNHATESSGALMFQPGSHKTMNSPIDFWHPDYVDRYLKDEQLKKLLRPIPTKPGDLIVFHSNVLHASAAHLSPKDRYALISRWISKSFSLHDVISMYDHKNYLYNSLTDVHAFDSTHDLFLYLLEEKYSKLDGLNRNSEYQSMPSNNFEEVIEKLILAIRLNSSFSQKNKALHILMKLKILKKSEKNNYGRNSATFLYKVLWHDCILPLLKYFNIKYII